MLRHARGRPQLPLLGQDKVRLPASSPAHLPPEKAPVALCANINGLVSKRSEISALLAAEGALVIGLQETKTSPGTDTRLTRLPGYRLFRKDRTANGGGVAVAVARQFRGRRVTSKEHHPRFAELEALGVEIGMPKLGVSLIYTTFYRPPSQTAREAKDFLDKAGSFIADILRPGTALLVTGDFNWDLGSAEASAAELLLGGLGLVNLNPPEATHGKRRLDWVWATPGAVRDSASLLAPLERRADGHAVLRLRLHQRHLALAPRLTKEIRLWSAMDGTAALEHLEASGVTERVLAAESPDEALTALYDALAETRDAVVPVRRVPQLRPEDPSWLTPSCIQACEAANKAHSAYRRLRDSDMSHPFAVSAARIKATKARNARRFAVAEAKHGHQRRVVDSAGRGGRLWEVHDRLAGRSEREVTSLVLQDGTTIYEPAAIASELLSAFQGNQQLDPRPLPPPSDGPAKVPAAAFFSHSETRDELRALKLRKAAGPDGLPGSFLRTLSPSLVAPLTLALNLVVYHQVVPDCWKVGWTCPLPKTPSATLPGHHRPITILDGTSKVFERRLLCLYRRHLQPCNKLQFGFAQRCSTSDALANVQVELVKMTAARPKPARVAVVSFDCRRAFDQLPHSTILKALEERGAPEYLLRLTHSWLSGRRSRVKVGDTLSEWGVATSGCPQGSLTGPTLFAHAIDSVFGLPFTSGSHLQLYADDALLMREITDPDSELALGQDCERFVAHLASLGLSINASKSAILLSSQSPAPPRLRFPLSIGGQRVPEVDSLRLLGVLIDRRFSFAAHWTSVSASAKRALGAIGYLVHWEPRILRHLLKERVLPMLLYGLGPCSPTTEESWRLVDGVLRYAAHRLTNRWDLHGEEILSLAGLPSAKVLAERALAGLLYSSAFQGRRLGLLLPWGQPRRQGLRVSTETLSPELRARLLAFPDPPYAKFRKLFPGRARELWNVALLELGSAFLQRPTKAGLFRHLGLPQLSRRPPH